MSMLEYFDETGRGANHISNNLLTLTSSKATHKNIPSVLELPLVLNVFSLVFLYSFAYIKGALDKYNIYLFIANSTENFKLNQY